MIKITTQILLFLPVALTLNLAQANYAGGQENSSQPPLQMTIVAPPDTENLTSSSVLTLVITNEDKSPVRILDILEKPLVRRAQLTVDIRRDEKILGRFGGGNISLPRKSLKYVQLNHGETFHIRFSLSELVPRNFSFIQGEYEIQVTYTNRYGDNCFQGKIESQRLQVSLLR